MSKRISTCISQCSAKMTDILSWKAKLTENKVELTPVLIKGFQDELDTRMADIKNVRLELERIFALRIADTAIDEEPPKAKAKAKQKAVEPPAIPSPEELQGNGNP
ncbi:unnamed protein product [Durusdinium trenchii]|uniref:Uncharacterized protein n=1 Tax=Durusdinium trenchii TaxID=1381693 RepID=A0ABP0S165_9DINO